MQCGIGVRQSSARVRCTARLAEVTGKSGGEGAGLAGGGDGTEEDETTGLDTSRQKGGWRVRREAQQGLRGPTREAVAAAAGAVNRP
jgi:hypothetical protein